ncbi:hypothetical protein FDH38_gp101 [Dinoroseobacter phage vB_DshS-R5C]|uniref:Uncharacterized protein n=1 Tax=Dinoroseobacter phage vB_DshS-R5C TaxID=1965368 RepID=A0A1V0DYD0_9CAUD|nr:hypothetical protein FDH38_gp101 [Dinoroseobacter phage vB_DshS-R5C]ARB06155.1 hypothetical protein vBDshSR5C_101 [Dinoroseobacter phage vB_DshS-R5C]
MGNKIRIVKRYNDLSPKAGITEADVVDIEGGAEGAARFVTAINANPNIDFEIIDYEVALITKMENPEILENKTGGATGKVLLPGKDF